MKTQQSRRRFLGLIAAGAAAIAANPSRTIAKTNERRKRAAKPSAASSSETKPSAAVAKEIASQKKSTAKVLETIRAYQLPAGSEMAFSFKPLKVSDRKAERSGT